MLKKIFAAKPKDERHFEEARVFEICQKIILIVILLKYQDGGYTVKCCGHYMYRTVVTMCTAILTFNKFYVLPTQCIYVFCVYLRTNSDYFPIQH